MYLSALQHAENLLNFSRKASAFMTRGLFEYARWAIADTYST